MSSFFKISELVFLLSFLLMFGCEKASVRPAPQKKTVDNKACVAPIATNQSVSAKKDKWSTIPPEAVLVSWKGNKLTKADFDQHVKLMSELIRNRRPKISDEKLEKIVSKQLSSVKDELISRMMLLNGLALTNSAEEVARVHDTLRKKYEKKLCARGQSFDQFLNAMDKKGLRKVIEKRLEEDSRLETAYATTYSSRLEVSEEEYSNVYSRVMAYNVMAKATNDLNWAAASNVLKRLDAGESFAKLADEVSQDPEKKAGGDLGECDPSTLKFGSGNTDDFIKTPYWQAISSLRDGEHTGILETDVGLEIIMRQSYVSATNSNSGLPAVRLSRIYFRTPYIYPPQSEEEFRDDLVAEKRESFMNEVFKELQEKDRIVYPQGEGVFPKASKAPIQLPNQH